MPGLAISEMMLVLVAIILFVRPDDLPKFVRTLGNFYGTIQRYFYQARAYTRSTFYEISTLDQPPPEPTDYDDENYCDGTDDDYHKEHGEYDHDHDYHEHDEFHHDHDHDDDHTLESGAEATLDTICAADISGSDHGATEDVANSAADESASAPPTEFPTDSVSEEPATDASDKDTT
jgi:Sec-independent protein translocase protein TatA